MFLHQAHSVGIHGGDRAVRCTQGWTKCLPGASPSSHPGTAGFPVWHSLCSLVLTSHPQQPKPWCSAPRGTLAHHASNRHCQKDCRSMDGSIACSSCKVFLCAAVYVSVCVESLLATQWKSKVRVWLTRINANGELKCMHCKDMQHVCGQTEAQAESSHCREQPSTCQGNGSCVTSETGFVNDFLRSGVQERD